MILGRTIPQQLEAGEREISPTLSNIKIICALVFGEPGIIIHKLGLSWQEVNSPRQEMWRGVKMVGKILPVSQ